MVPGHEHFALQPASQALRIFLTVAVTILRSWTAAVLGHLKTMCDYVHLNPVRAGLLARGQKLGRPFWSSYPAYLLPARKRPGWLLVDRLLGEHGLPRDTKAMRREFALRMEARRASESDQEWKPLRRGWCWGGKRLSAGPIRAGCVNKPGPRTAGKNGKGSEVTWAQQMIRGELKRWRWTAAELAQRQKGDGGEAGHCSSRARETTMTLNWIAERLNMGAAGPREPAAGGKSENDMRLCGTDPFMLPARKRPGWLRGLAAGNTALPRDTKAMRREFVLRMEARRASERGTFRNGNLWRGWCWGGKDFRRELLEQMREQTGPNHGGEERRESEEAWAQQMIRGELKRRRWTAAELAQRRKGDLQKLAIARRLRRETTMTLNWIAERLNMGAAGSLANLLRNTK